MNALRRFALISKSAVSSPVFSFANKRFMGGGHGHPPPKYEGFELTFRTYLPESHHVVYFLLGMYASIGVLVSLNGSSATASRIANLPAPSAPDYHTPVPPMSSIPTMVDNPKEWEAYVSQPGGFERYMGVEPAPAGH